uniref:Si:ch211-161h7.5 n=1 Tax=Poecilia formosa TaxID=48698 RepID=A0A087XCZ4_POEFO
YVMLYKLFQSVNSLFSYFKTVFFLYLSIVYLHQTTMGKHNYGRLAAILVSVAVYAVSLVFNGLSVVGVGPYTTTTGNVSAVYDTELTPSGWTFNIWTVIYIWLSAMIVYIVSGLCRRNGYGYVYCSPAVLPYGFFISWCLNQGFNISWLLVWDRGLMIPALIFLILLICTNYSMVGFICHGLHVYGPWLNKYSKVDLWLIRMLVLNGVMIYTTWTTIATLLNLTIVLKYEANMSTADSATLSYSLLSVVLLVWFVVENFVLDRHMRYVFIPYVVVIWALSGNLDKNYDASSPSRNGIFIAVLLAVSCVLFAIRIALVVWRHIKQPLYEDAGPKALEVSEIAEKQKKIFR